MGIVLQNLFTAVVNEIYQDLPILGESGSEVSYFIIEHKKIAEVNRLSEDIRKPWFKALWDGIPSPNNKHAIGSRRPDQKKKKKKI